MKIKMPPNLKSNKIRNKITKVNYKRENKKMIIKTFRNLKITNKKKFKLLNKQLRLIILRINYKLLQMSLI
mgnify:CR=1 FL=1